MTTPTPKPKAKKPAAKSAPDSEVKRKVGAPTKYTEELGDAICDLISRGISLTSACKETGASIITFWAWLDRHEELRSKYVRAREAQADYLAEEILSISDEKEIEAQYQGENVKLDLSSTAVQRNRLRVDARKWYASKVAPKKYGDKIETAVTGAGGGPLEVKVTYHSAIKKNAD